MAGNTLGRLFTLTSKIHHDHAQRHADLDCRQPDAGRVIHRLQHVIHQSARLIGDAAFDGFGHLFEARIWDG
mgnify:CR=1 FL=1